MTTTDTDERSAPELAGDLIRAVLAIVRSTARIFGVEARVVSRRIVRRVALIVGSSVVAVAGAVLLLAGVALLVERAVALPRWAAFAAVGAIGVALGACGVVVALRRLGDSDVAFPETVAELEKDLAALERRGRTP